MSTTCPCPRRRAWKTAIKSPLAPWIAVQLSASGTVTGSGARSGKPGVNCTPENAWAKRSSPRAAASVCVSSTTSTSASAPPRSPPGNPASRVTAGASRDPEDARRVAVEPFLLHRVLERQAEVLVDQRLVRLPHEPGREADEHLVLDQRVAELHQHLPARPRLAEIAPAVGRGVHVQLRM